MPGAAVHGVGNKCPLKARFRKVYLHTAFRSIPVKSAPSAPVRPEVVNRYVRTKIHMDMNLLLKLWDIYNITTFS